MALQIDLKGKVAIITGISSGIGEAIAKVFAQAGADIVGCATGEKNEAFIMLGETYGVATHYISTDVTKEEDLKHLVEAAVERFERIDILISNAGSNVFEGAGACNEERWQHNINLNLASHWMLAKFCKPYLDKSNPGVIVIMTSNHAFSSIPGCFPYNVTKTALTGLVRALAIEWGPTIRTVGIAPGFIDTSGNQKWFDSFLNAKDERQKTIDLHPVKRIGTPEEAGAWCAFLASDYAAFASGTTYVLDGGRSALMQDS
jgi:NAD(P)-dependent dehydrogenase (short-subunit alcohol dehydrogenase family)